MSVTSLFVERQKRDKHRMSQVARVFSAFDSSEACCMKEIKNCAAFAEYRVETVQGAGVWSCQRHLPIAVERFLKFDGHEPERRARARWVHLSHGLYRMTPYRRGKWRKQYRASGGQYF